MKTRFAYGLLVVFLGICGFMIIKSTSSALNGVWDKIEKGEIEVVTQSSFQNQTQEINLNTTHTTNKGDFETRPVLPYKQVEVLGPMNLSIRQMNGYAIELSGNKSGFSVIESEVKGDKLIIKVSKKGRDDAENVLLTLCAPTLESLSMKGSGNLNGENIRFEKFNLEMEGSGNARLNGIINNKFQANLSGSGSLDAKVESNVVNLGLEGSGNISFDGIVEEINLKNAGSGKVELNGKAKKQDLVLKGSGEIKASGMTARKSAVIILGSGDCTVTVEDKLDATVKGSGSLKYAGKPKVSSVIKGSGRVERL